MRHSEINAKVAANGGRGKELPTENAEHDVLK